MAWEYLIKTEKMAWVFLRHLFLDIFIYCFTLTTRWGECLEVKEDVNSKIMELLEKEAFGGISQPQHLYGNPCRIELDSGRGCIFIMYIG